MVSIAHIGLLRAIEAILRLGVRLAFLVISVQFVGPTSAAVIINKAPGLGAGTTGGGYAAPVYPKA